MKIKRKKVWIGSLIAGGVVGISLAIALPLLLIKKNTSNEVKPKDVLAKIDNKLGGTSKIEALSHWKKTPTHVALDDFSSNGTLEEKIDWLKLQTNIDLSSISNLKKVSTQINAVQVGDELKITIAAGVVPNITRKTYLIYGYKTQAEVSNELWDAINKIKISGSSVARQTTSQQSSNAIKNIVNAATLKEYSGIDLTNVANIDNATFNATSATSGNVSVNITIPQTTKGQITYTITGF